MGMGSLTLACVLMLANAGPDNEPYYMNRSKMEIPITIDPEQRNNLRELFLFCSRDEGKSWSQVGRATPTQISFPFVAQGDGKYWFTIQTVDKNGVKAPADVLSAPVGQRIIVDTVRPQVKVKAERKGEEVHASWEINEDYPNAASFALEYHFADQPAALWTAVANVTPGATGTATFRPQSNAAVTVQLRVKDKAENEGVSIYEVPALAAFPAPAVNINVGANVGGKSWNPEPTVSISMSPVSISASAAVPPLPAPVLTPPSLPVPSLAAPSLPMPPHVSMPPSLPSGQMPMMRRSVAP